MLGYCIAEGLFSLRLLQEDSTSTIQGLLQAMKLWNRATSSLSRLQPTPPPRPQAPVDENPFEESAGVTNEELVPPAELTTEKAPSSAISVVSQCCFDGLEWRIAQGSLSTLIALSDAFVARGSAREAEYFAQQAHDLASSLRLPVMMSRALTRLQDIHAWQRIIENVEDGLRNAAELLGSLPGADVANVSKVLGDLRLQEGQEMDAKASYQQAFSALAEFDRLITTVEIDMSSPR